MRASNRKDFMNLSALAVGLLLMLLPVSLVGQVSITSFGPSGAYSQNFDNGVFLSTSDYTLFNNAPGNIGWYATKATNNDVPNALSASSGPSPNAGFQNYG